MLEALDWLCEVKGVEVQIDAAKPVAGRTSHRAQGRVVLLVLDALGPEFVTAERTPNLMALGAGVASRRWA
jgi:hypothetical protein